MIVRLALAAAAAVALAVPVSGAHAEPDVDPLCRLYVYEKPDLDPSDGTVSPGRYGWVC